MSVESSRPAMLHGRAGGFGTLLQRRIKEQLAAYSFVLPSILLIGAFLAYPIGYVVYTSFQHWNIIGTPSFVGWKNYRYIFNDPVFTASLWNTVYFVILAVPSQMAVGLCLAVLLNRPFRGRAVYRTIFFIPLAMSFVAAGLVFRWIFAVTPQLGPVPSLLGGRFPAWQSTDGAWAMPMVVLMNTWKSTGYTMIVYLAGLQGISSELYEAAAVDGVGSEWQRFRHISWPLLAPTTWLLLITTTIFSFRAFDPFYVMTNGGPAGATTTVVYYVYNNYASFTGIASAAATVLLAGVFAVVAVQYVATRWTERD